ncbi:MAG TPA: MAB_1171c family putative transporter [Streptosporangiaceae bacterium]
MIAGGVGIAVLWLAVLVQFPSQRRVPVRRLIWSAMLLLCVIGTLDLPQVGGRLDQVLGLPNAADVIEHILAIVTATLARYGTASIFGSWGERGRPSAVRLAAWPAAVIVTMVALFAVSPALTHPIDTAHYTDFPMQFAPNPAVLAYWLVFTGYLGITFAGLARLAWRYGRAAGCTRVGSGLLFIASGMIAGLGYLACGSAVVIARSAGFQGWFITTAPVVIQALFGALVVLVAAGCVLPAAPHCPVIRRVVLYWSLRRLYPLWDGLYQAVPGIALDPVPAWADRLNPRDLRMRLYRRVIEIRDGYLALGPADAPGLEDTVRAASGRHRLRPAEHAMIVAATRLELARRAALRGESPSVAADPDAYPEFQAGTDLDSEVRLLRTVAAHRATISLAAERIERDARPPAASSLRLSA